MSVHAVKIAISLPQGQFKVIEDLRKQLGIPRSVLFSRIVREWMKSKELAEKEKQYVEGYKKYPETEDEFIPMEMVAEALADYPWEP